MSKETLSRWADLLESGTLSQCRAAFTEFHYPDRSHCCLAVATVEAGGIWEGDDGWPMNMSTKSLFMPTRVSKVLGFTHYDERLFVMLNDLYELDFLQIAQVIRNVYIGEEP